MGMSAESLVIDNEMIGCVLRILRGIEVTLEEVRHANRQMRIAYEVSRAITTTLNPEDLYDLICKNILEHFDQVERVCIFRDTRTSERFSAPRA